MFDSIETKVVAINMNIRRLFYGKRLYYYIQYAYQGHLNQNVDVLPYGYKQICDD